MQTYWISFRLGGDLIESADYLHRWEALNNGIKAVSPSLWDETSSFLLFESSKTFGELHTIVVGALDLEKDIALLGVFGTSQVRPIGTFEDASLKGLARILSPGVGASCRSEPARLPG